MLVTFEMNSDDTQYADRISELSDASTGVLKSFSGAVEILQLGIVLTPAIVSGVALIVSEMIKNRRKVDIKVGDVEVKGLTEDNALELLNQLLNQEEQSKDISHG